MQDNRYLWVKTRVLIWITGYLRSKVQFLHNLRNFYMFLYIIFNTLTHFLIFFKKFCLKPHNLTIASGWSRRGNVSNSQHLIGYNTQWMQFWYKMLYDQIMSHYGLNMHKLAHTLRCNAKSKANLCPHWHPHSIHSLHFYPSIFLWATSKMNAISKSRVTRPIQNMPTIVQILRDVLSEIMQLWVP